MPFSRCNFMLLFLFCTCHLDCNHARLLRVFKWSMSVSMRLILTLILHLKTRNKRAWLQSKWQVQKRNMSAHQFRFYIRAMQARNASAVLSVTLTVDRQNGWRYHQNFRHQWRIQDFSKEGARRRRRQGVGCGGGAGPFLRKVTFLSPK